MRTIAEYMGRPVLTIAPASSLAEASELMEAAGVRHLVVVENGHPIGVLSDADIFRVEAKKRVDPEVLSLAQAMSPEPYAVAPDAPLADVAEEMARLKIGSAVVVMEGARPIGIFTTVDALKALADLARA